MPLFYQQNINAYTRLAAWKIEEDEEFFLASVPLQRNITHPHKRLQHLAGRYLLRYLFPDFPYEEILIADTRKPFLPDERYHFSISHCGGYAAAIVSSTQRVGIDIEQLTERVHRIKHKFLHTDELMQVAACHEDQQTPLLTLLWSAKEALFKWWGRGEVDFSEDLRLGNFDFKSNGIIPAQIKKETTVDLAVRYEMFEGLSLAWI